MNRKKIIYGSLLGLGIAIAIAYFVSGSKAGRITDTPQNFSNMTPLEVVNKRMSYFNAHNFEAFLKLYHTQVEIYTYPDKLLGTGSDRLASIFKSDFENKAVAVKIVNQMDNGPYVINHEIVTKDGKEKKYISIYKVEKGLISSVRFVRGR